jgi:hypothetical protein
LAIQTTGVVARWQGLQGQRLSLNEQRRAAAGSAEEAYDEATGFEHAAFVARTHAKAVKAGAIGWVSAGLGHPTERARRKREFLDEAGRNDGAQTAAEAAYADRRSIVAGLDRDIRKVTLRMQDVMSAARGSARSKLLSSREDLSAEQRVAELEQAICDDVQSSLTALEKWRCADDRATQSESRAESTPSTERYLMSVKPIMYGTRHNYAYDSAQRTAENDRWDATQAEEGARASFRQLPAQLRALGQAGPVLAADVGYETAKAQLKAWVAPHFERQRAAEKTIQEAVNLELDELLGAHQVD